MIKYFGPFASALGYIIHSANEKSKNKLAGDRTLYRGIKLMQTEIDSFETGKSYNLTGFTSTSRHRDIALGFALTDQTETFLPVLLEIQFSGQLGLLLIKNGAFDDEEEVLLQDGL